MIIIQNKSDINLSIKLETIGFIIIPYHGRVEVEYLTPTDEVTLKKLSRDYLKIDTNSSRDLKKYTKLDLNYNP